jgi:hypothetical protein
MPHRLRDGSRETARRRQQRRVDQLAAEEEQQRQLVGEVDRQVGILPAVAVALAEGDEVVEVDVRRAGPH